MNEITTLAESVALFLKTAEISNDKPGGHEMGAVMVSKYAPSYEDLKELIYKYDIKTTLA